MRRILAGPKRPMTTLRAGGLLILIFALAMFFGFTKKNPFSHQFRLKADFVSASNIKPNSPVRIAGVNVGKVKQVMALPHPTKGGAQAEVVMEVKDEGLPIHRDAVLKVRPRTFLEGNFYVDLRPGSPSAPVMQSGDTVPPQQTGDPVQLGQVLTALQSDTRQDLRTFLYEYSVKGLQFGGARGFDRSIPYWVPAYRNSALANEATLGTQQHDLHRVILGQQKTLAALASNQDALRGLITNFNTTALAFARQDTSLEAAIPALRDVVTTGPPALRSIDSSLPGLNDFARDALPGVRSSGPTLDASRPFLHQSRLLVSEPELRGLTRDLTPTIPALARLNSDSIPFFNQNRAMSACANNVTIPFSETPISDPDKFAQNDGSTRANTNQPFFRQAPRGLVGLAGESRINDANSPFFRIELTGGSNTAFETGENGQPLSKTGGGKVFAQQPSSQQGTRPAKPTSVEGARPVDRPGIPCELQQPPDLHAPRGNGSMTTVFKPDASSASATQSPADLLKLARSLSGLGLLRDKQLLNDKSFMDKVHGLQSPTPAKQAPATKQAPPKKAPPKKAGKP